ncbi:CoA ester lyase [Sporosarcina sp. ACRSL]|uniref:HpcH/HpaI aldolase/citrate lyase family protein n=1 Tax=Sporosarcina sp. ACRSL TaxID=2918215 RepID=UPI001EF5D915|nr:CoA ester lyase [Sporosarcina sp. ACRSL]MCG7343739.1 CoA ester lyase [Sporosarcina sp. ACRSL]
MLHPHRSRLIMPVINERFVQKSPLRNADIIVLDLEDSVPHTRKIEARSYLLNGIEIASKGGSAVYVRVNNSEDLLWGDIQASISPRLTGIYVPKVESAEQIEEIDNFLTNLEVQHKLKDGSIQIAVLIETAKGYMNLASILQSSKRIQSVSLGAEDFVEDLQMKINNSTAEALKNIRMQICIAARAYNIVPMGLMSSITNYTDLEEIADSARLAYEHGFAGNSCVHPSNVEIFNNAFMPNDEEVEEAKQLVEAFEKAVREGLAAIKFKGKMIDIPHYEKAKRIHAQYEIYRQYEDMKKEARMHYEYQLKGV